MKKPINFENLIFFKLLYFEIFEKIIKFIFKTFTPCPLHFGIGILIVKMAAKFEILSLYSSINDQFMSVEDFLAFANTNPEPSVQVRPTHEANTASRSPIPGPSNRETSYSYTQQPLMPPQSHIQKDLHFEQTPPVLRESNNQG